LTDFSKHRGGRQVLQQAEQLDKPHVKGFAKHNLIPLDPYVSTLTHVFADADVERFSKKISAVHFVAMLFSSLTHKCGEPLNTVS